ncbi:hypothetical protein [uncultured Sphingomonas sp.]|uniref:hypothetical protein n=1 Tax=uncultured Sphingomonas sp. TaxID=158754 RepID=UPI0025D44AE1|nr:hypothetical protein [uncultured Sphingomonas sp.]
MSLPVFLILLILTCGYAGVRGGGPERWAASLLVAAYALGLPVHLALRGAGYDTALLGGAAIDVVLLVALIWLAHRSTRYWPLWLAGWQFAAVVAHLAKMLDPTMQATGYAVQAQVWGYPMVIALAIGAWRHCRRRRAGDADPDWKSLLV